MTYTHEGLLNTVIGTDFVGWDKLEFLVFYASCYGDGMSKKFVEKVLSSRETKIPTKNQ